jgi:hypothetical protein
MLTYEELEEAIWQALPDDLKHYSHSLTALIINTVNKRHEQSKIKSIKNAEIDLDTALLRALAALEGKPFGKRDFTLNFGENNQFGDISIEGVAGRDINKIYISLGHQNDQNTKSNPIKHSETLFSWIRHIQLDQLIVFFFFLIVTVAALGVILSPRPTALRIPSGTDAPEHTMVPSTDSEGIVLPDQLPTPTATNATITSTIELADLIYLFLPDKESFARDWSTGAESSTPIQWITSGIFGECPSHIVSESSPCRYGIAIVTIDGEPISYNLEQNLEPAYWEIFLSGGGIRIGFEVVTLRQVTSTFNNIRLEAVLNDPRITLTPYKCDQDISFPEDSSRQVYSVNAQNKGSAWIAENYSCGSGGCWMTLEIYYNRGLADEVQCLP